MKASWLLISAGAFALAHPANAQTTDPVTPAPAAEATASEPGDIIVTATRRSQVMTDVPLAISAVTSDTLRNAGATDIRQLNQLSPSLLVSSTSSEAVGGVARIRGIGTVGDNPGLESSVATFIDGVYRSRSGVALTELGAVDRIEVARGPQGTLFGRNASAGLINVITKAPSFDEGGNAEFSYGNYHYWRAQVGLTGPINEKLAYRVDGVITKRRGFMKESDDYTGATGRRFNNRNRWLVRGQLLFNPDEDSSFRLIADYAKRNEECCAASYLPARNVIRANDGTISFGPNTMAGLLTTLGAKINQNYGDRLVSVTPGRDFRSDVRDWGISGEYNREFGDTKLTSITAYRQWSSKRGQDADFNNLDLLYRDHLNQKFKTFTQELRLNGKAFDDKIDWLIGGYYGHETLTLEDNLRFGTQYGLVQGCRVAGGILPQLKLGNAGAALAPGSAGCLNPIGRAVASVGLGPTLLGALDRLAAISNIGPTLDTYKQTDDTWAIFTHNVFEITSQLSVTLGARYTHDRKKLDANIVSNSNLCGLQSGALGALLAGGNALATSIAGLSCANNIAGGSIAGKAIVDGSYNDHRSDSELTGTAVVSYKPTDRLMSYLSWSRGFKAGGYNLDRAGLVTGNPLASQLRFAAETVNAWEIGAKYRGHGYRFAVTGFYQTFNNFQLNTFNGTSFIVENVQGCSNLVGGDTADSDLNAANGKCAGARGSGVVSKGVELEASFYPTADISIDAGYTYADTHYRNNLTGVSGRPLTPTLFQLPGSALSNAPKHVATGSLTWTPAVGGGGMHGLFHVDGRFQSRINTGSDLLPEKLQKSVTTVNGRIGISGADGLWGVELWAQNLFNVDYKQTVAGAPIQGTGSLATVAAGGATPANGMFIVFPAEPRTWGLTVRTKF